MNTIRTPDGKQLLFGRSTNANEPEQEAYYDGTGKFVGISDGRTTRDASGNVVVLGRAPAILIRR